MRSLFQFVGKRWRRLDVVHGMCAGYLVGCGWWGGRRVGGVLVSGPGFWLGLGFRSGVSGGWPCSSGGSRCLAGGCCDVWGLFPLDPSLTPAPTCLVGCGSWFGSSLCWVVQAVGWWASSGCSSFLMGWAGLVGGLSCGLCPGWVVLNLGSWLRFSLAVQVRPCVRWGCFPAGGSVGCVSCRGVVLKLAVLFPLGGPTWTVGLFAAPLFLPPRYTMETISSPNPVGKLTR